MAVLAPLVLGEDGLVRQSGPGDALLGSDSLTQIMLQNNAIIRLLCSVFLTMSDGVAGDLPVLDDNDVEALIAEITP